MRPAAPRPDEARSQQALDDLRVLDSAAEPEFEALVQAASLLCGVPIALISLIDRRRQWFKAQVGLPGLAETPRELAFCAHTVLEQALLEVPDARQDERFADNPLVTGQPGIRFYAGAPLQLRSGHRVGTLCLIDRQPRQLSDSQREALQCLAVAAAGALEGRRARLAAQQAIADQAAQQQRLHNIIEGTHAGIWEWHVQTGALRLNERSAALLGQTPADLGGQTIALRAQSTHPDDWPLVVAQMQRHLSGESDYYEVESRVRHRDGHWVWILDRGRLMTRSADGRPEWVFGTHQDISRRKQLEQQLIDSERSLRLVMDASPQGMLTIELTGHCRYTNAAWRRIAGLTPAQSLGLDLRSLIHPDDLASVLAQCQAVLDHGGIQTSEHRYRRADGSLVWVRGHLALLRQDGKPDGLVGTIEDITERHQLDQALAARRAELARSNQDLERFAYVASHDLQEPLRMVTSYGQLLMRRHQAELSAEAQEFLHYMVDGGNRAQALIRDLLSLARIDKPARPHQAVPLASVLAVTLRQLHLKVQETGARISHDALPTVVADPLQIGQLLANLLGNALKFRSQAPPVVHIGAQREDGAWRISVQDNGIGIDPRHFERVFVMFQRLHLRSEHEGTGIGLAICKQVVQNHGGQIGVRSVPGQGATFFFTLPDAQPAPLAAADTPQPTPGG